MADFLSSAVSWLADMQAAHISRDVLYRIDGSTKATVSATLASSTIASVKENGLVVSANVRDYIVRVSDLTISGQVYKPDPSHRIVDGDLICQPLPMDDDHDCYRYTSGHRISYRIHTKVIQDNS